MHINAPVLEVYATNWNLQSGIKNNLGFEADMKILLIRDISLILIDTETKQLLPLIVIPKF